jgi:hypothetical protein
MMLPHFAGAYTNLVPYTEGTVTIPRMLAAGFGVLAAVLAIIAAYFWWKSSQVKMPPQLRGHTALGGLSYIDTNPLVAAAQESGRLNASAARWSAAAAVCGGIAAICGLF